MQTISQATPLDRLVQAVVDKAQPLRIILFGSAARSDAGAQSDIDLLVVMPDGRRLNGSTVKSSGSACPSIWWSPPAATWSGMRKTAAWSTGPRCEKAARFMQP